MLHPYLKYIQTQVADSNVGTYLLDREEYLVAPWVEVGT